MKILVVDSNRVFARKVGEFLTQNLKSAEVKFASNVPILKQRLRDQKYDYIIADILTAFDAEAMRSTLEGLDTPMLVWSVLKSPEDLTGVFKDDLAKRVLHKPNDDLGIETAMSDLVLSQVGV